MYKRNSKYSRQQNSELEFGTLDALMKYPGEYLTIEGIKSANGYVLGGIPTQKMSRVLGTLTDMGLVRRRKKGNRVEFCSLATKEGDEVRTPFETEGHAYANFKPSSSAVEINWELDEERGVL